MHSDENNTRRARTIFGAEYYGGLYTNQDNPMPSPPNNNHRSITNAFPHDKHSGVNEEFFLGLRYNLKRAFPRRLLRVGLIY